MGFNLKVATAISEVIKDLQGHMNDLQCSIKQDQLPDYLMPGNTFLGKYNIKQIISYREIIGKKLLSKSTTAFENPTEKAQTNLVALSRGERSKLLAARVASQSNVMPETKVKANFET